MANSFYKTAQFDVLIIIYGASDQKNMFYSSLKRSRRAELNGGEITNPRAIIGEILSKMSNGAVS